MFQGEIHVRQLIQGQTGHLQMHLHADVKKFGLRDFMANFYLCTRTSLSVYSL